jgi:hypothetical protein
MALTCRTQKNNSKNSKFYYLRPRKRATDLAARTGTVEEDKRALADGLEPIHRRRRIGIVLFIAIARPIPPRPRRCSRSCRAARRQTNQAHDSGEPAAPLPARSGQALAPRRRHPAFKTLVVCTNQARGSRSRAVEHARYTKKPGRPIWNRPARLKEAIWKRSEIQPESEPEVPLIDETAEQLR